MRSCIRIESNYPRRSILSHCLAEEAFGGAHIPSFAQQEVDGSPVFVDGSIEVGPTALHLYIGLITSPGTVNRSSVAAPALFELRNITLHPAQNRRASHDNSAFGHHLDGSGANAETNR